MLIHQDHITTLHRVDTTCTELEQCLKTIEAASTSYTPRHDANSARRFILVKFGLCFAVVVNVLITSAYVLGGALKGMTAEVTFPGITILCTPGTIIFLVVYGIACKDFPPVIQLTSKTIKQEHERMKEKIDQAFIRDVGDVGSPKHKEVCQRARDELERVYHYPI